MNAVVSNACMAFAGSTAKVHMITVFGPSQAQEGYWVIYGLKVAVESYVEEQHKNSKDHI